MTRTSPHPHKRDEKIAYREEVEQQEYLAGVQRVEDARMLMSTTAGRREVYRMLGNAFRLPGQRINNTNGSIQSFQLGCFETLRDLDEVIRENFNDQWNLMREENAPKKHNND